MNIAPQIGGNAMKVSSESLSERVRQAGFPAIITGRHDVHDGEPVGYPFMYVFGDQAGLDKQTPFITGLDIMQGTFSVQPRIL
jgi:hypothetical protein